MIHTNLDCKTYDYKSSVMLKDKSLCCIGDYILQRKYKEIYLHVTFTFVSNDKVESLYPTALTVIFSPH